MYIWVTHFSHFFWELCVCAHACMYALSLSLLCLPPSLLRACLVTGSTPLLSATFVLEVRISGVPRSEGRLAGREWGFGRGRRTGQRGWELNNGWFLIEIKAWWKQREQACHYLGNRAECLILNTMQQNQAKAKLWVFTGVSFGAAAQWNHPSDVKFTVILSLFVTVGVITRSATPNSVMSLRQCERRSQARAAWQHPLLCSPTPWLWPNTISACADWLSSHYPSSPHPLHHTQTKLVWP